ncbi:MAG: thioredoxin domain-containing protein [Gammaproteobacteria bacterium]|nr:thioredoxin domain-containing protein [Gammaproteobacteria bacterium]
MFLDFDVKGDKPCHGRHEYWQMHDALFANQRKLGSALYETTAKELALDEAAFKSCLSNPAMKAMVEADFNYGGQIGVSGTPKFFVGRVKGDEITDVVVISGAQGFSAFSGAVERLEKL